MTTSLARSVRKLKQAISRRLPTRRDDSGLTTLEWLLIVAAVAGLAALAVVLVQNVVDDTSEQIAGSSARKTAAQIAASDIMADADRDDTVQPDSADTWTEWFRHYTDKCNRLKITYGDAGITVIANFATAGVVANTAVPKASIIDTADVSAVASVAAAATKGVAHCAVS